MRRVILKTQDLTPITFNSRIKYKLISRLIQRFKGEEALTTYEAVVVCKEAVLQHIVSLYRSLRSLKVWWACLLIINMTTLRIKAYNIHLLFDSTKQLGNWYQWGTHLRIVQVIIQATKTKTKQQHWICFLKTKGKWILGIRINNTKHRHVTLNARTLHQYKSIKVTTLKNCKT